jgi:23S rRNA U2552 (ribose-2'-O)-methylase RlmE/FtsJ
MERYEPAFMYLNHVDLESYACQSIFLDHTNTLEVSREEAVLVCKVTRGQSHNKIWKKTRKSPHFEHVIIPSTLAPKK